MAEGIVFDKILVGTPFRGLIARSEFCYCAYLGVPSGHWLSGMDELQFPCHWGLTYSGPGDGVFRPADWYWYGWDYGHAFDAKFIPPELQELLPTEVKSLFSKGKSWTVAEIEQDLIDAALALLERMKEVEAQGARVSGKEKHRP